MNFVITQFTVVNDDELEAAFDVRHANDSMRGRVAVVIPYVMTDTLAQITARAGEALERAMAEEPEDD